MGRKTIFTGASILALSSFGGPAFADAGDSSAIVVMATRTPIEINAAPATITVITDEDIADQMATDIKDLVRFEPGVSVRRAPARFGAAQSTTGRAGNEGFNIRGIGGNRVLIQVDGIRTPQGFSFGAQDAGRGGYTDVSLIKSVEILRGPASALYGSDGLSGAISFTTSDPNDLIEKGNQYGGFARAQYSSADKEFSENIALAGNFGAISAMLAYSRRDFKELDNQADIGGVGSARTLPNPQDGRANAVLGKLVWENGNHRARLTGEYLDRQVDSTILSGQGPAILFGPNPSWIVDSLTANDKTKRTRVSADWTWTGDADGGNIIDYAHVAAYWQKGTDRQFADEDRSPVSATPRPDRERLNIFENRVFGAVAELRSNFNLGGIGNHIAFGGDISWTRQEGLRDGVVPPFGEVFPTRAFPVTDFTLGGIYLGNEISFADGAVTIFPALRFDFYKLDPSTDPLLPNFVPTGQSDSRLSPKIGAVAKLSDEFRIFGNYARGFRAPTPSQVNNFFENLAFGYTSAPNPDLKPETSKSIEAGLRFTTSAVNLSVTAFRADYDDFIDQQAVSGSFTPTDPAVYQFVNLDKVKISGIEAKAEFTAENGLKARMAIAYAKGDARSAGGASTPLDSVDPLNLVIGVGYRAPDKKYGGELIMTHHARKAQSRASTGYRPDAFTILDATAFARLGGHVTLRAGLFNITNEKYAYWNDVRGLSQNSTVTDAYTQPGRNLSVSISAAF